MAEISIISFILLTITTLGWEVTGKPRIIDGTPTVIEDVPYFAQVYFNKFDTGELVFCAGAILNKNHILTAAHCCRKVRQKEIYVLVGSDQRGRGQRFDVESFTAHPTYNNKTKECDACVIKLRDQMTYNSRMQPVSLPTGDPATTVIGEGAIMYVAGFGRMADGEFAQQLQIVVIFAGSKRSCQTLMGATFNLTENHMCAGRFEEQRGPSSGDSGSMLMAVSDGNAYGITSFGRQYQMGEKLHIFAFIPPIMEWIGKQMQN